MTIKNILGLGKKEPHHKELEAAAAQEAAARKEALKGAKSLPGGGKMIAIPIDLSETGGDIGKAIMGALAGIGLKPQSFEESCKVITEMATETLDAIENNAKLTEKQRDMLFLGFSENFHRFATCMLKGHSDANEAQLDGISDLADKFFNFGNEKDHLFKSDYITMLKMVIG